jgi:hypothetical protein
MTPVWKRLLVSCASPALLALAISAPRIAHAQPIDTVALGSDYFATAPGTQFTPADTTTTIPLMGVPLGPGNNTDTIVQRQADAVINGPSVPIQLTALQLESTGPVPLFGNIPIFVSLDPANLSKDTGTITITGSLSGGTFSSFFDVFFDICTAPGVNGIGCGTGTSLGTGNFALQSQGPQGWLPTPPPDAQEVKGAFGDQAANTHTGLPDNEVDFFPGYTINPATGVPPLIGLDGLPELTPLKECDVRSCTDEAHFTVVAKAPEPGTLALLATGLLGLLGLRRRRS